MVEGVVPRTLALPAALVVLTAACPSAPGATSAVQYEGRSESERRLFAEARRDVYPDDVRPAPQAFATAILAWSGVVISTRADASDAVMYEVVIEHHYWDWMERRSAQSPKAFLSRRGEGELVCHAVRHTLPSVDLRGAMAIVYARPTGMKDGQLHANCVLTLFPRDWYATDVFEYGRDSKNLKLLRAPAE
jgi:hypothetical protein